MAMITALLAVLVAIVGALWRILKGPKLADRLVAIQLVGSGGIAVCLILAWLIESSALVDVALLLALLSVCAAVAMSQRRSQ